MSEIIDGQGRVWVRNSGGTYNLTGPDAAPNRNCVTPDWIERRWGIQSPIEDIRHLHARYGVGDIGLDYADDPAIPDGWKVVVRCWDPGGFLRRGFWDALIRPPHPTVGWRLASPHAPSRKAAIRRAIAEIQEHLAPRGGMA